MKQKCIKYLPSALLSFFLMDSSISSAWAAQMNMPGSFNLTIALASFVFGGVFASIVGFIFWKSRVSQFTKAVNIKKLSPLESEKRYCGQASKTTGIVISLLCFIGIFFMSYIILGGL